MINERNQLEATAYNLTLSEIKVMPPIKHIKPKFNISDEKQRLRYFEGIPWNPMDDFEDFWWGSDTSRGYEDEIDYIIYAFNDRHKQFKEIEIYDMRDISCYSFYISELLSKERMSIIKEDFENLKSKKPEFFEELCETYSNFNKAYEIVTDKDNWMEEFYKRVDILEGQTKE